MTFQRVTSELTWNFHRVNPRYKGNKEVNKDTLSSELNIDVEEVEHLNALGHCFFRFPSHISISNSSFYKESVLYGIDLSSAATVIALDVHSHHHVLDLCCAPGAKLAMISDIMFMKNPNPTGTVTGVDISNSRLSICRTLCKRYQLKNVRLFLQDATKFNFLAPDATLPNVTLNIKEFPVEVQSSQDTIPKLPKKILKKRKRSNNTLENLFYCREWTIQSSSVHRYDRVLVDAQCTLDASVRHLLQHQKQGVIHSEQDDDGDVTKLQKRLIMNAFHLVKEDGYLVYSTCSFCASQNEDVVQWLLDHVSILFSFNFESPLFILSRNLLLL